MKLMTYNIKVGVESSTAAVGEVVQRHAPDLLALQEVGVHWEYGDGEDQPKQIGLMANLPRTHFFPALEGKGGTGHFGVALLSRYPMEEKTGFFLSSKADEQRVLLLAKVRLPNGEGCWVGVTHLSIDRSDRTQQAKEVAERMRRLSRPRLLMGDLNDLPGSGVVASFDGILHNACGFFPEPPSPITYPGPGATGMASRDTPRWIDYLFLEPSYFYPSQMEVPMETASDHLPVIAHVDYGIVPVPDHCR